MFLFRFRKHLKPRIIPRSEHALSRSNIDPDALKVLHRLASLNHEAYLVGGSVRDLLLGRQPKDFDVGTDARPNEIRKEFRNCFLVGRRFRLAHIVFGKKVIETATFRKAPDASAGQEDQDLYQMEDNTFGTPEEDALRRDFTVNGLFYDIKTFSIIDYVGGLEDLKAKRIRSIGDPAIRFREDPVRMMRAVRFAAKLGFDICPAELKAMRRYAPELAKASLSRLCEEIQRLFVHSASERSIRLAFEYGLLAELLPSLTAWMREAPEHAQAVWDALHALDAVSAEAETTPAMAFAALYYPMACATLSRLRSEGGIKRGNERHMRRVAGEEVLRPAVKRYRLPRTVWMTALDILELSARFASAPSPTSARDVRFVNHALFPELMIGARVLAKLEPKRGWQFEAWKQFYESAGPGARLAEGEELPVRANPHRRRPRRRKARKPNAKQAPQPAGVTSP